MVFAVLAVIISGVFIVGSIKGWFDKDASDGMTASEVKGIVRLKRSGVSYSIEENSAVREGDVISTLSAAEVCLSSGDGTTITLAENTTAEIKSLPKNGPADICLEEGEIFVISGDEQALHTGNSGVEISSRASVYSQSVYSGVVNVSVFDGKVIMKANGKTTTAEREKTAVYDKNIASGSVTISELYAESLDNFVIGKAVGISKQTALCFDTAVLEKIVKDRKDEKLTGGDETAVTGGEKDGAGKLCCTITIKCDTILDNLSSLADGKSGYVPEDGMILEPTKVYFNEGETAFDVLKRVCEKMDIQLEYSWTPIYNSHYVEGINHLYEFDCGPESGWMYKSDGWFPNYGASAYKLKDGDSIIWAYTCRLGEDVGSKINR